MAPKRSIQTLIQSIRETLEEMRQEGHTLGVALWQEADADAGYLVHVDGRMVPAGEYQYGFEHIDELTKEYDDPEVANWARSEAGKISGSIDALNDDFREQLNETFAYAFGPDSDLVEQSLQTNKTTIEALFELWSSRTGAMLIQGSNQNSHAFEIAQDVSAARLDTDEQGQLYWKSEVVLRAGESATGSVDGDRAYVQLSGLLVQVPSETLSNVREVVPTHTRRCHP